MTNILVVDDHESIRKLIEVYLSRAGYQVYLAADGQDEMEGIFYKPVVGIARKIMKIK